MEKWYHCSESWVSLTLHHQPTHIKLLSLTWKLIFLLPNHFFCLSIALLLGLYYLRHYYQIRCPQSFAEKGYYFPNVWSNVSLYTALRITACLGTVLHCVCNSNLSSVFSHLSPLVILISRAILLIDFRLFSWGLFLFVLFSIYGVLQNLASTSYIHPSGKSYSVFEVVLCLLQIDMNKLREGKTNLSGRSDFGLKQD